MALWNGYGISTCAILSAGVVFILYLYLERKFGYWRRRGVPSPNLYNCLKQLYEWFTKPAHEMSMRNYKNYGRVYGIFFGLKPALSIGDPDLLKYILVKDFQVFPNRMKMKTGISVVDNQISILQGEHWKRIRSIITPTFSSGRIKKMMSLVKECAIRFSEYCERVAEVTEEVDCKKLYSRFSIDIIASTTFGTKINALENPDHPFVRHAKVMCGKNVPFFVLLAMFFPTLGRLSKMNSKISDAQTYFRDFALHVIEERDKNNIHANDFLQLMLDAQRGKLDKSEDDLTEGKDKRVQILPSNRSMSLDEVLAQCLLFFRAGSDTSSNTLSFISYYLALHPQYQQRLIEEIDDTWNTNKEINFDVLSKMTYLEAFIKEVMRVQPVAAMLMRLSDSDYALGDSDIRIGKDTTIIIPIYAMHHDPDYFPEPEKFDPERFMPENLQLILPYTYLPFGIGPRNCIGMRFAMMVLKLCVVYTLRKVRFEATEKTKKPLEFLIGQPVLQAKEVWVRMVKRNDV